VFSECESQQAAAALHHIGRTRSRSSISAVLGWNDGDGDDESGGNGSGRGGSSVFGSEDREGREDRYSRESRYSREGRESRESREGRTSAERTPPRVSWSLSSSASVTPVRRSAALSPIHSAYMGGTGGTGGADIGGIGGTGTGTGSIGTGTGTGYSTSVIGVFLGGVAESSASDVNASVDAYADDGPATPLLSRGDNNSRV
jgi:hypothetical protein